MTISRDDLIFAIDDSFPYPIEYPEEVLGYMADRLLGSCLIEKNPDGELWNPAQPDPEVEIEVPTGVPPKPTD